MTAPAVYDDELRNRLKSLAANTARPNWRDVRQRARTLDAPRHRRHRLSLAAALVAAAVAAPALAIATGIIDFSSAPPATAPIKVLFRQLAKLSGPNIPGPITAPPRLVYTFQTASGSFDLAAPADNGGWCWIVVGREGTCNTRDGGLNYGANQPPPVAGEPLLIDGSIAATGIAKIAITFEDGSTLDLPFVQVSAPIDADFFLYEIPSNHWTQGNRPATIAAYNSNGTIVGSGWFIRESDKPQVGTKS